MALLVPNTGEVWFLTKALANNTTLHLFSGETVPAETDTAATYTEITITGYAAKTLTGGSWTIATDASGVSTASYAAQTFDFTAGGSIAGYMVKDGTTVIWAERFSDGPYTIPSGGGKLEITPTISAD